MKKLLILSLLAFDMNAKAQIVLENIYPQGELGNLRIIHLTNAGYKYSEVYGGVIKLYDLNHSLYKTINIPNTAPLGIQDVYFISDELFNTNPSDIEYLVTLNGYSNMNIKGTRVYDENGNIVFTVDSFQLPHNAQIFNFGEPIFFTPNGVKMILHKTIPNVFNDSIAVVYSLPGILPCNDCTNGVVSGLANDGGNYGEKINLSNSYPTPAINSTRIDYTFPDGVNEGEIVFYDLQGKEVKRYKVDKTFDHLLISTADIPAGTYLYQLQTSAQSSAGKKMVVIK